MLSRGQPRGKLRQITYVVKNGILYEINKLLLIEISFFKTKII